MHPNVPTLGPRITKLSNIEKARLMSPYDRKRYWEQMQDRAIRLLMRMIELKDVEKASAAFTVLCEIGTLPADETKKNSGDGSGAEDEGRPAQVCSQVSLHSARSALPPPHQQ